MSSGTRSRFGCSGRRYAGKPVINAGDGVGEHPTQALLDVFTIREELGHLDDLTVTMLGDLKYGRTVHSLARLLTRFDNIKLHYVSPDALRMPPDVIEEVAEKNLPQEEHRTLEGVLSKTDVLYVTRVQRERFENLEEYEKVKEAYVITPKVLEEAKEKMIIMHLCRGLMKFPWKLIKIPEQLTFGRWNTGCMSEWLCWPWFWARLKPGYLAADAGRD